MFTLHPYPLRNNAGKRPLRVAIAVIILFCCRLYPVHLHLVRLFSNEESARSDRSDAQWYAVPVNDRSDDGSTNGRRWGRRQSQTNGTIQSEKSRSEENRKWCKELLMWWERLRKRGGRTGKDGSRHEVGASSGIRNGTRRQEDRQIPNHNEDLFRH